MSTRWLTDDNRLRVGTQRGSTLDDVAHNDPAYLRDLLYVFGAGLADTERELIEAEITRVGKES